MHNNPSLIDPTGQSSFEASIGDSAAAEEEKMQKNTTALDNAIERYEEMVNSLMPLFWSGGSTDTGEDGGDGDGGDGSAQPTSPDPNLPVNPNYVMALENDAGTDPTPALPLEGRQLEYDLHTAPDSKNPYGKPLSVEDIKNTTITETLDPPLPNGTKNTSESGTGAYVDVQGRNGDRKDKGVFRTTRYFTAMIGKRKLGVIPILDATGKHNTDTIKINMSTGEVNLNDHVGRIDLP